MPDKKGIVISDMHCGAVTGLTPPKYRSFDPKWSNLEGELWDAYQEMLDKHAPYDFLFDLGDNIDGKGLRSSGTELITSDRNKQVEIAKACIDEIPLTENAYKIGVKGTPYHVGAGEDFEDTLADLCEFDNMSGQEWVDVNGIIFDLKHKVGNTSVPYGKGTPISKERIWNLIWTEHDEQPKANVLLRGHVHYFFHCGESTWTGIICPALQGQGTKYGARECSGRVDFGVVYLFVSSDGDFTWDYEIKIVSSQQKKSFKIL